MLPTWFTLSTRSPKVLLNFMWILKINRKGAQLEEGRSKFGYKSTFVFFHFHHFYGMLVNTEIKQVNELKYELTLKAPTAHVRKASSCPLSSSPSPMAVSWAAPSSASFWSMSWAKAQNSGYMLDPKPNTAYLQKEIKRRWLCYAKWNANGLNHMQTKQ